jgi:hypothetical protein
LDILTPGINIMTPISMQRMLYDFIDDPDDAVAYLAEVPLA